MFDNIRKGKQCLFIYENIRNVYFLRCCYLRNIFIPIFLNKYTIFKRHLQQLASKLPVNIYLKVKSSFYTFLFTSGRN